MRTTRSFHFLTALLIAGAASAQAPQGFNYQAVARTSSGDPLVSQAVSVQFVLHRSAAEGAVVYAETHSTATNEHGLFSLVVGNGTPGAGSFAAIDWSHGPYFLEVGMDVDGSGAFTSIGTQQLMSVPFALYAAHSSVPDGTFTGQTLHWDGGAWVADSAIVSDGRRFGIGTTQPEAPLGITADQRGVLSNFFQKGDIPTQSQFRLGYGRMGTDSAGFSVDEVIDGVASNRIYIYGGLGNVGINETIPDTKLHVGRAMDDPSAALSLTHGTGLVTLGRVGGDNLVFDHRGLQARHGEYIGSVLDLTATALELQRVGGDILIHGDASIVEDRRAILTGDARLGLGTITPVERLDVNGALVLGTTDNPAPVDGTIRWTGTDFEGRKSGSWQSLTTQAQADGFTSTGTPDAITYSPPGGGHVGINELSPDVALHVTRPPADPHADLDLTEGTGIVEVGTMSGGNLVIDSHQIQARTGTLNDPDLTLMPGTLHLQPRGGDLLVHGSLSDARPFVVKGDGKVGIGVTTPSSALQVVESVAVDGSSQALVVENHAVSSGADPAAVRVGLQVRSSGPWGGGAAKNVGIHVSDVSGASNSASNLAAVLNGNVVIGDVTGELIGDQGQRVLAVATGAAPSASSGAPADGVQLFATPSAGSTASILHVMNGDGSVIHLYRQAPLSPPDTDAVGTSYGTTEAAVIENLRTRINELEQRLTALGLLP